MWSDALPHSPLIGPQHEQQIDERCDEEVDGDSKR